LLFFFKLLQIKGFAKKMGLQPSLEAAISGMDNGFVFFSTSGDYRTGFIGEYIREDDLVAHLVDSFHAQNLDSVRIAYNIQNPHEYSRLWIVATTFIEMFNHDAKNNESLECYSAYLEPQKSGMIGIMRSDKKREISRM